MDPLPINDNTLLIGALVVLVGIVVLIVLVGVFLYNAFKPRHCSKCHAEMPVVRMPKNMRQALWGGWTCSNCGCELDRKGREISGK